MVVSFGRFGQEELEELDADDPFVVLGAEPRALPGAYYEEPAVESAALVPEPSKASWFLPALGIAASIWLIWKLK